MGLLMNLDIHPYWEENNMHAFWEIASCKNRILFLPLYLFHRFFAQTCQNRQWKMMAIFVFLLHDAHKSLPILYSLDVKIDWMVHIYYPAYSTNSSENCISFLLLQHFFALPYHTIHQIELVWIFGLFHQFEYLLFIYQVPNKVMYWQKIVIVILYSIHSICIFLKRGPKNTNVLENLENFQSLAAFFGSNLKRSVYTFLTTARKASKVSIDNSSWIQNSDYSI